MKQILVIAALLMCVGCDYAESGKTVQEIHKIGTQCLYYTSPSISAGGVWAPCDKYKVGEILKVGEPDTVYLDKPEGGKIP